MSQYNILVHPNVTYGSFGSYELDVSGFTLTLNPLATQNVGDPFGYGGSLEATQMTGSGNYGMMANDIGLGI